jgi:hypothetical protein
MFTAPIITWVGFGAVGLLCLIGLYFLINFLEKRKPFNE